jgi:tRNA pseudouridine32 synthase / 23S rRNA pseudouridine746 synthase
MPKQTGRRSTRKHAPRGVPLIYEDAEILVVDKPCGLLSMGSERNKSRTVQSSLNDYVRKGNPKSRKRVYIVHRLDRDTSGLLIFAKSERAKAFLQSNWESTSKTYLAVVSGQVSPERGTLSSYLVENAALNVYSTPDPTKGRLARTDYCVIKGRRGLSLVHIQLLTGRKHQIRVHFAEMGHPVVGDRKYGQGRAASANLALHASSITFTHPVSGARVHCTAEAPGHFARLMGAFAVPTLDSAHPDSQGEGSAEPE